jgi:ABC-type multidrug transport system ATPase subunit
MLSMDLSIQRLTKSFNQRSVFENLTFAIPSGIHFAITPISDEAIYKYIHFVAPYNTVIEELNLSELFSLHQSLGQLRTFTSLEKWMDKLEYNFDPHRQIKAFSSGMKQRVKLGLALLDNRPLILLDEPGSTLDVAGKEWLYRLIGNVNGDQTIVIATNDPLESDLCSASISVANHNA